MKETICYTLKEFELKYQTLLNEFLTDWEDNTENDFLESQKELYKKCIKNTTPYYSLDSLSFDYTEPLCSSIEEIQSKISEDKIVEISTNQGTFKREVLNIKNRDLCNNYNKSFEKIIEFISLKIEPLEIKETISDIEQQGTPQPQQERPPANINTLDWYGSQLEFTELVQALYLSKKIGIGQDRKIVFEKLRNFFNIDSFNEADKIRDIKDRTKDNAKFINQLETSINSWSESKD